MSAGQTKVCQRCGEAKSLDAYYSHPRTADRLRALCKTCHNKDPRSVNAVRINRQRARNRATADLVAMYPDEFQALLEIRLAEAAEEAEALAQDPEAREHYGNDTPPRLRPGKRMPGQKAGDRIDVARCPHCIKHHDRGHVCTKCGAAPSGALKRPEDGIVDEVAVERAANGEPVQLTPAERAAAVRLMTERGASANQISQRLHCDARTVQRIRAEHGIESSWTTSTGAEAYPSSA